MSKQHILPPNDKAEGFDIINSPAHYGTGHQYETYPVIEAMGLSRHYRLANAVKYIKMAGVSQDGEIENLQKALWYLKRCEPEQLPKFEAKLVAQDWRLDTDLEKAFFLSCKQHQ